MFISAIIPSYNVCNYVSACINSLINQDTEKDSVCILIVDDGSTDYTAEIIDEYCTRFSNIIIAHGRNKGVSSARNSGLLLSNSDYLCFIDPDDFVRYNTFGSIQDAILKTNCDALYTNVFSFDDSHELAYSEIHSVKKDDCDSFYYHWLCSGIFKTDAIKRNHIYFNEKVSMAEDCLFSMELQEYIHSVYESDIVWYFYRNRANSLSKAKNRNRVSSYIEIVKKLSELASKHKDCQSYKSKLYFFTSRLMWYIAELPASESRTYLGELQEIGLFPLAFSKYETRKIINEGNTWKKKMLCIAYTQIGYKSLRTAAIIKQLIKR